jgi:hypothetical protein
MKIRRPFLLAAALSASACDLVQGMFEPLDSGRDDTGVEVTFDLPLLGTRVLDFSAPSGSIEYRLEVGALNTSPTGWFIDHEDDALAVVDEVLGAFGLSRFAVDDGFADVEARIVTRLSEAYRAGTGDAEASVLHAALFVVDYQAEEDAGG